MLRLGKLSGRRWLEIGLVLGVVGSIVAWARYDPWPAKTVIVGPKPSVPAGFTLDGRSFVTMNRDGLIPWDIATGKPGQVSELPIRRRSLASDRRSVVGVTGEDRFASAVVWVDLASGKILANFPLKGVQALSPTLEEGGRSIRAVLIDRGRAAEVVTWDVASGAEAKRSIAGPAKGGSRVSRLGSTMVDWVPVAISPDGRTWAYVQLNPNGYILWDSETDRQVGGLLEAPPEGVGGAAFGPDGRTLVIGCGTSQFNVWDLAGPRLLRTIQVDAGELSLGTMEVSPDGRTLASAWMRSNARSLSSLDQIRLGLISLIPGWWQQVNSEARLIDLALKQA